MRMFNHEKLKAKPYSGQPVLFLHEKLDGHRVTFLRQGRGYSNPVHAFTRENNDLWPELIQKAIKENIWFWLTNIRRLPFITSIDGELYVPGKPASYVKTAIKNCDPELKFSAFAVPYYSGDRFYDNDLSWAMEAASDYGIEFAPYIRLDGICEITEEWALSLCPEEVEGYVAKMANYNKWYKIKKSKTLDAVVTGIKMGLGKYKGMCGALVCSVYNVDGSLVDICLCSGMTDEERSEISDNDIGRVVEVKYQEVATIGRLRHPNFVRWRDDKVARECTVSQDLELLRYWSKYVSP